MNVLISIKPEFVEKIISHEKRYEFRRRIFKKEVKNVIIYSTAPSKKIVGYFELEGIIKDSPKNLWNFCSDFAGINEKDFFNYFEGLSKGFALKIGHLELFENFVDVDSLEGFSAPQSFKYLDDASFDKLISLV